MQEPGFVEYIGNSVLILGHHNADLDAVGSAIGVKYLIEELKPETKIEIAMPDGVSRLTRKVLDQLNLETSKESTTVFDTIIIVDCGSFNQLGDWANFLDKKRYVIILIDHHTIDDSVNKQVDLLIHDEEVSSTCELVYGLYEKYKITPSIKTAKLLLSGIAFDTKFFSIGDSPTFLTISKLLDDIGDISKVLTMLHHEADISERIARLKTGQRSEIHRFEDWIIVFSEVSSFQASGARALISLGADLAVVASSEKDRMRVSLRSTQVFYEKTGLHLGEIVSRISLEIGGSGSGHPTAAGYNNDVPYEEFTQSILELIKNRITSKSSKIINFHF